MFSTIVRGLVPSPGWIRALFFTAIMLGGCSSARNVETAPSEASPSTSETSDPVDVQASEEAPDDPCMVRCMQAVDNVEGCNKRCEIWACIEDCKSNGGEETVCRESCGVGARGERSECQTRCGMGARQDYAECIKAEGSDEQTCKQSARAAHEQCVAENCTEEEPGSP